MDLTVVITGATRGIGRVVAEAFAKEGAFVAICGTDGDAVDETVTALAEFGSGDAWGMRADVRDEFDMERFLEIAAREGGPVDVLVPNAAVCHGDPESMPLDEESYAQFDDTMRTNVRGVFATITEAVPHLAADARIIVPSDATAQNPTGGAGSYAVSKAGAEAVARGFAVDLDQTVGIVDPGLVATDLTGKERARDPETVAPLFVWAATDCPAEDLDGGRVGLRDWKDATR